jgi:hypothetical protein
MALPPMAIPAAQLATWTGVGSVQQSSATYQSIKNVLEHKDAPYASRRIDSFLQGSYGNDTNIYGDSDVDIVLRTRGLFYYDIDALPDHQKTEFKRVYPTPAEYTLKQFKTDVIGWLNKNYGGDLDTSGQKALRLKASGNRRSADVLLVAPHKKYSSYVSDNDATFVEGVLFLKSDGTSVINYPKQHSDNVTAKHQVTNDQFKPTVRIFKNMRNKMVEKGFIKEGAAPSYFIEGLLWNVPNDQFVASQQTTVENCYNWFNNCDQGELKCANGIHPLIRDVTNTSWPIQGYIDFAGATRRLCVEWK